MEDRKVDLQISSCLDEPPAPVNLTIQGSDDKVLLTARLEDPGWAVWKSTWRKVSKSESDPDVDTDLIVVLACLKSWSLDRPISLDALQGLHWQVQRALAEAALNIFTVRAGQIKNSDAPSISNAAA